MKAQDARVILTVAGITKTFPGQRALDDVSLEVRAGEIVALLGQNGSGKSTLVKVLDGVHTADSGRFTLAAGGGPAAEGSRAVHDALHVIHQDLGLVDTLSTVENLGLGRRLGRSGLAPTRTRLECEHARQLIHRFGVDFDVSVPVARLTPAQRTIIAIARAMASWSGPDHVLILDEPTAALHAEEVATLIQAVQRIAATGSGVVFISHRLEEVTELAHRVVVLRSGRVVAEVPTTGLTATGLARLITGSTADQGTSAPVSSSPTGGDPLVRVRGLAGGFVRGVDFDLHRGEVLGLAGNLGSGREHIAGLLFGAVAREAGEVTVDGRALPPGSLRAALRSGIGYIPADRHAEGGIMTMSVTENLTLPDLGSFRRGRVHLDRRAERAESRAWCEWVGLDPLAPQRPLGRFSGGNQQKALLARWLRMRPTVLLADEPTQGVDVGAKEAIRRMIADAAEDEKAVLVASSDHADLVRMCTRVLVLREGVVVAELTGDAIDEDRLTQECLGVGTADPRQHAAAPSEMSDV